MRGLTPPCLLQALLGAEERSPWSCPLGDCSPKPLPAQPGAFARSLAERRGAQLWDELCSPFLSAAPSPAECVGSRPEERAPQEPAGAVSFLTASPVWLPLNGSAGSRWKHKPLCLSSPLRHLYLSLPPLSRPRGFACTPCTGTVPDPVSIPLPRAAASQLSSCHTPGSAPCVPIRVPHVPVAAPEPVSALPSTHKVLCTPLHTCIFYLFTISQPSPVLTALSSHTPSGCCDSASPTDHEGTEKIIQTGAKQHI